MSSTLPELCVVSEQKFPLTFSNISVIFAQIKSEREPVRNNYRARSCQVTGERARVTATVYELPSPHLPSSFVVIPSHPYTNHSASLECPSVPLHSSPPSSPLLFHPTIPKSHLREADARTPTSSPNSSNPPPFVLHERSVCCAEDTLLLLWLWMSHDQ